MTFLYKVNLGVQKFSFMS